MGDCDINKVHLRYVERSINYLHVIWIQKKKKNLKCNIELKKRKRPFQLISRDSKHYIEFVDYR